MAVSMYTSIWAPHEAAALNCQIKGNYSSALSGRPVDQGLLSSMMNVVMEVLK
ncbi:hypothetical protein GALL_433770 [mine drainage metagenome]|uniref:Uncharacterized protein n=1 Tax=mine drainage metagenome TaxID=410659 RepID=A0A1J5PU17_9ZZZZ